MEMEDKERLRRIDQEIRRIKEAASALKRLSGGIQAVDCNADRILASARMLELNFSDLLESA